MDKTSTLEQELTRVTEQELTRNEKYGHLVLALVAGVFGAGLAMLIATEPGLPTRTVLAFAVLFVISLSWVAYSLGVLMRRRPLLANREIVAGRMSLLFSALFTIGAMLVGITVSHNPFTGAVGWGLIFMAFALALLIRAHIRRASLQKLRARLEAELAAVR
jgi:hypothetical protein